MFFCLLLPVLAASQALSLKKGIIIDNIAVNDSVAESFAIYLPSTFEMDQKWPVVFVYDMQGRGKQVLSMFREAAEGQGYILAASNNVNDTLTMAKNVLVSSRMFNTVYSMLPIERDRTYTAGFSHGARMASIIPSFIGQVKGVIACGAAVANVELLNKKNPYYFIGVVGVDDFNYPVMANVQKYLNKMPFPNQLLVFEGGEAWPPANVLAMALETLTLSAMAKGVESKNNGYISQGFQKKLGEASTLMAGGKALLADKLLTETAQIYSAHKNVDSLKESIKTLRKSPVFRAQQRAENAVFLNEQLLKEDYAYYLEEDRITYNYNNLGWWKYQMDELKKYRASANIFEQQMAARLKGYINALIADHIDLVKAETRVDEEALNLLWMVNTVTDPTNYDPYLNIISYNSKVEDYGTALFYLEELLKNGYSNADSLYGLPNTAILRISPEFNTIVAKYLKTARYEVIDE